MVTVPLLPWRSLGQCDSEAAALFAAEVRRETAAETRLAEG